MQAQTEGHYATEHLEESGIKRGCTQTSSLKGPERAIIKHANTGTVSKLILVKLLRDGGGGVDILITLFPT